MIWRAIVRSMVRRKATTFALLASLSVGTAMAAALGAVALEAGARVAAELRAYGANLEAVPAHADRTMAEADLPKIKTIFWRHNIVGIAPWLERRAQVSVFRSNATRSAPRSALAETASAKPTQAIVGGTWHRQSMETPGDPAFELGVAKMSPDWRVAGRWYAPGKREAVVGRRLARRLGISQGSGLELVPGSPDHQQGGRDLPLLKPMLVGVVGILNSGSRQDDWVLLPLDVAQQLFRVPGRLDRVQVSAVTVPLDELGRRDPKTMTKREYDKWYCTAYVTSVGTQVQEALTGSTVRPLWRVAEAEGRILDRVTSLVWILVVAALVASALAVASTMTVAALRRRREIGLMKALGARDHQVASLILGEATVLGLAGGVVGLAMGTLIARVLGSAIFGVPFANPSILAALCLAMSPLIALSGSALPVRQALSADPADVLRGTL